MTRPGWYQEPASTQQRYWDGRAWSDHEPDPPRLRASGRPGGRIRAAVLTGFGVLVFACLGVAVLEIGADRDDPQISGLTAPPEVSGTAAPVGSTVRDGDLEFVVTALDFTSTADAVPTRKATGRFVNVHVRVINIGAGPTVFTAANQKLHAQGQVFPADPQASLGEGYTDLEVRPGSAVDAVVSFDVPLTVESPQMIELHDALSSGGARIALQ